MKKKTVVVLLFLSTLIGVAVAETVVKSDEGSFTIKVRMEPSRPVIGDNAVMLTVLDRTNNPVEGAVVEVVPWMTAHSHGSSRKTVVKERGKGVYFVEDVTFTMAGDWDLLITIRKDQTEDRAIITVRGVK